MAAINQLQYGRSGSKRGVRVFLLIAAAIGIAWAIWHYGPAVRSNLQWRYLQRQWANCEISAGEVVFDTGVQSAPVVDPMTRETIRYIPGTIPDCRRTFPQIGEKSGTVFLHMRRSSSGTERIVCVDVLGYDVIEGNKIDRCVALHVTSYQVKSAPDGRFGGGSRWYIECGATQRLRLFAGQVDARDQSHFTLPYEIDGVSGVIDGFLRDDETIDLIPDRGAPAVRGNPRRPWVPREATRKLNQ